MAAMNVFYPIIIIALLLYSYVYEALACHGNLSASARINHSDCNLVLIANEVEYAGNHDSLQ